jgi:hypothetical protein
MRNLRPASALLRASTAITAPSPREFHPGSMSLAIRAFSGTQIDAPGLSPLIKGALMTRGLLCIFFLLNLGWSGFAQTPNMNTTPAFYVVLNSLTRICTVVDKRPRTDSPNITVASDAIYRTRAEAEAAAKTLTPCSR